MAPKKARQALDRSRKVVNTKIYIYNELFTWAEKYSTNHPRNRQGIQAKKTSTKDLHSKKKYNVILQGTGIKVKYIKPHHQEKGEQY